MNIQKTCDLLRLALGGIIAGGFLGVLAGACVGLIVGAWLGDLGLGLDGALLGAGVLGCGGAVLGVIVYFRAGASGASPHEAEAARDRRERSQQKVVVAGLGHRGKSP